MLTRTNVRDASIDLVKCARLNEGRMRCAWWVKEDTWYDATERAIRLGLQKSLAHHMLLVHGYLNYLFFAASLSLEAARLGALMKDVQGFYFELSEEGWRQVDLLDRTRPAGVGGDERPDAIEDASVEYPGTSGG
jgi:hypothetical protein